MAPAIRAEFAATLPAQQPAPMPPHAPAGDAVVWSDEGGRPLRLIWNAQRWRVTDRPTVITSPISWWWRVDPLGDDLDLAPAECVGWRFQATNEHGEARVFDIHDTGNPRRWRVAKTYC